MKPIHFSSFFVLFTVLSLSLCAYKWFGQEGRKAELAEQEVKRLQALPNQIDFVKKGDQCLAIYFWGRGPAMTKVDCTPAVLALIENK